MHPGFDTVHSGSRLTEDFRAKIIDVLHDRTQDDLLVKYLEESMADRSVRSDIPAHLLHAIIVNGVRSLNRRLVLRGEVLVDIEQNDPDRVIDTYLRILMQGIRTNL